MLGHRPTLPASRRSTSARTGATLVVTLATTAVLGLAGCAGPAQDPSGHGDAGHGASGHGASSAAASDPARTQPSSSGTPATGPHSAEDVMFAQMMIPHHRQALEMSRMIMDAQDVPADVTALARQISEAQGPEITRMSGWLAGWGEDPGAGSAMQHGSDDGMLTQAELDALDQASGRAAAELFLTGMIAHHQGAVRMAEDQLARGQNPEAKQLARDVVDSQQAEITTMRQLLDRL